MSAALTAVVVVVVAVAAAAAAAAVVVAAVVAAGASASAVVVTAATADVAEAIYINLIFKRLKILKTFTVIISVIIHKPLVFIKIVVNFR